MIGLDIILTSLKSFGYGDIHENGLDVKFYKEMTQKSLV